MLILNPGTILSQYITFLRYVYWTMRLHTNSYFLTSYSHNLRILGVTGTENPSTQPLLWRLTTGTLCTCSLGILMQFRIICDGNLLPSANTSNMTVTQVIILFTMSYHMWQKSNKLLLAIYGTVKFYYEDTTRSPASYAHTTHTGLEMMPRDVSLGKFPCFIFYCLTSK